MKEKEADLLDILCGSRWNAGLEWYDFVHSIEFRKDGTGSMSSGSGQALHLAVDFRYRIEQDRRINFEFLDTVREFWGETFRRTAENTRREVTFELVKGSFQVDEPYTGTQSYQYLLRFSSSPFPVSVEEGEYRCFAGEDPDGQLVEFYGHQASPIA